MCLAVPLKITEINGNTAVCEANGMFREIRIDFVKNPKVGEYIIAHAGFAIEKLPEQQALDDLAAWDDVQRAMAGGDI